MTYLEMVQEAMKRAKVRSGIPTTLVGATDAALSFKEYVQDSWRELQEESTNWWFRQKLDQTLAISASTDEYAMPSNLETINYRTCSIYTTAKQDETPLTQMDYEYWRTVKDTVESSEGRPEYIVERPDYVLQVWPVPDQAYTMRYDGVWDIDTMLLDADTPGSNISGGTLLDERYHWVLVYDAARRFYEDHEDAEGLQKMQTKYLAQHARLKEKRTGPIHVPAGVLTGLSARPRRLR